MKRDWARVVGIGGALVVIQSVIWEYARMKPDNSYAIEPWSHRGFETVHGTVYAVIGLALLLAFIAVAAKTSQATRISLAIVAAIAAVGWAIAVGFTGDNDYTLTGDSAVGTMLAIAIGLVLLLVVKRLVEADLSTDPIRRVLTIGALVVAALTLLAAFAASMTAALMILLTVLLLAIHGATRLLQAGRLSPSDSGGELMNILTSLAPPIRLLVTISVLLVVRAILGEIVVDQWTMPAHIGVLLVMIVLGLLVSSMRLPSMAANRMLMASTIVAGAAVGGSGGAIRSTLIRLQAETDPFIPGEFRDTQVTWGYFLANIGILLVLAGAIMLWARRRDIVQSQQRAAKQRAAAEESARELAAAG